MSDTIIKLKKSSVGGKAPTTGDIGFGELAINYADGKIYYKNSSNEIKYFIDSDLITSLVDSKLAAAGVGDSAQTLQLIRDNSIDSGEAINLIDDQSIVFSIALG